MSDSFGGVPPGRVRPVNAASVRADGDRVVYRYAESRNHPDDETSSGLSPYLHFGHLSAHEIFRRIEQREGWTADDLGDESRGRRTG